MSHVAFAGLGFRHLYEAQIVSRNITSSLAFMTWDICITLDQELAYIWMTPAPLWGIKFVYLFLRYFGFFSLIATQAAAIMIRRKIPVALHDCHSFFLFQVVSAELIVIAASIIVMTQVYALYNRRLWVAIVLFGLLGLEIIVFPLLILFLLPKIIFNPLCFITLPTSFYLGISLLSAAPPVTSFIFIITKQIVGIREGWGNAPLMVLMTRDGTWGVMALIGIWIMNPLIGVMVGKPLVHVGHLWFMSVIPSTACRVILNIQHVKLPPDDTPSDSTMLTTDIDMGPLQSQQSNEV